MIENAVEVPAERVYYYEVSRGDFRLLYFIPAEELERLAEHGKCHRQAMIDYPDGIDLPCTLRDFQEFEEAYSYRPDHDPEALARAFYALWTDTKDWQVGTHAGFVPAHVLEDRVQQVMDVPPVLESGRKSKPDQKGANVLQRRSYQAELSTVQAQLKKQLEQIHVSIVDGKLSIAEQSFPKIQMQKGVSIDRLFNETNLRSEKQ